MKISLNAMLPAAIIALALAPAPSFADSVAFTPTNGGFTNIIGAAGNDGFLFTPTTNIDVTSLGYYEDGLPHVNEVGIFKVSDQSLIVSTSISVPATSDGNPTDPPVFTFAAITPTQLLANTQYVVTGSYAFNLAGQYITALNNVTAAPGITYNGYVYNTDTSLSFPSTSYDPGYFGPNFTFIDSPSGGTNPNPVPLPASLYSGSALLALLVLAKFRTPKITAA